MPLRNAFRATGVPILSAVLLVNLLAFALAVQPAWAGWSDHAPAPVNYAGGPASGPGEPNIHHNSGGRRIVRINGTTLVLAPFGSDGDRIYRSRDDGKTWSEIARDGVYSGALISGPDSLVYHFYIDRGAGSIFMVKFKYSDRQLPGRRIVYHNPALTQSGVLSEYRSLNAAVDSSGVLYVATHWGVKTDRIFVFRSADGGATWTGPVQVSTDDSRNWYYPHLEVTGRNTVVLSYHEHNGPSEAWAVARSRDGKTWSDKIAHVKSGNAYTSNPALVGLGGDSVVAFVQGELPGPGVFCALSTDAGASWGPFRLVERTCSYGDPSGAVGADGTLYVTFRSSRNTGVPDGECGGASREKLSLSKDRGRTWTAVDSLYDALRTGTRSHLRYQTWWNYGGPLEWTWMQFEKKGGYPIYYDLNRDVLIRDAGRISKPSAVGGSLPR
jgi:hypothetical protein